MEFSTVKRTNVLPQGYMEIIGYHRDNKRHDAFQRYQRSARIVSSVREVHWTAIHPRGLFPPVTIEWTI
jgi:hypothetical protein